MHSDWRCADPGVVPPFHVAQHIGPEILAAAVAEVVRASEPAPLSCPWPLPPGWTVPGAGWGGDERLGVRATALACSGPDPLGGGPADIVIVAEQPGVGLGTRFGGIPGIDCGNLVADSMSDASCHGPHAKIKAG